MISKELLNKIDPESRKIIEETISKIESKKNVDVFDLIKRLHKSSGDDRLVSDEMNDKIKRAEELIKQIKSIR